MRHSAGVDHRLLVLFNGFGPDQDITPWQRCLDQVRHDELRIPTPTLDLTAYRQAVEHLPAAQYCFLNSYSVIRQDGWLELMRSISCGPRVGAVGASGSWGSQSSHARYAFGLGGPYSRVFGDRRATDRVFTRLSPHPPTASSSVGSVRLALARARGLVAYSVAFPAFPSPHLRSNCLMIDRDLWLRVVGGAPRNKWAAYRLESGRRGITARLKAMGLRAVVAGRDGRCYDVAEWPASRTFWQGRQQNLLIEDNQTHAYEHGDAETRRVLSGYAWGPRAEPVENSHSEFV
jgi:hypothetical protein